MSQIKAKYIGNKAFYKRAFITMLPALIHQLTVAIYGVIDALMARSISPHAYTGVLAASKITFIVTALSFGVISGLVILLTQFVGAKREKEAIGMLQLTFWLVLIFGILFFCFMRYLGPLILNVYIRGSSNKELAVEYGVKYLNIMSYASIFILAKSALLNIYRSFGKGRWALFGGMSSAIIGSLLSYLLLYGNLGFNKMGIEGIALAGVICHLLETHVMLFIILFFDKENRIYKMTPKCYMTKAMVKQYFKHTPTLILTEGLLVIGGMAISRLVTLSIGTNITIYGYFDSITTVFYVLFTGIGVATKVMIGHELGKTNYDTAKDIANKMKGFTMFLVLGLSLFLVVFSPAVLLIYTKGVKDIMYFNSYYLILIYLAFMIFTAYNHISYFIMRSGGKTFWIFLIECLPTFGLMIPLLFILYRYNAKLNVSLLSLFAISKLIEILKSVFYFLYLRKDNWAKTLI